MKNKMIFFLQHDALYGGYLTIFFYTWIIRQSGSENSIDSHAWLQTSHSSKLKTVAWVVELIYLHIVVKWWKFVGWKFVGGKKQYKILWLVL